MCTRQAGRNYVILCSSERTYSFAMLQSSPSRRASSYPPKPPQKDRAMPFVAGATLFVFESCICSKQRLGGTASPGPPAVQSQLAH
jgi:hypothetical protein